MILSIFAVESPPITATKAIREALRKLHEGEPRPSLRDARDVLDAFHENGYTALGETLDADGAADLILALRANGVFVTADGNPERAGELHRAMRMREQGATPEETLAALAPGKVDEVRAEAGLEPTDPQIRPDASAATALALLSFSNGHPLNAAAYARTLALAQGERSVPMWRVVQQNIIATFPWVETTLKDNGALL